MLVLYACIMFTYSFALLDNQRPEPEELNKFLTAYCQHWRGTGLKLGLNNSVLNQIASAHPMEDRERFRVTLERWSDLNVGVTWGNLELAITNANRESLNIEPLTGKKIAIVTKNIN